jgi:hypothetical protein
MSLHDEDNIHILMDSVYLAQMENKNNKKQITKTCVLDVTYFQITKMDLCCCKLAIVSLMTIGVFENLNV